MTATFNEQWFSDASCEALADLARRASKVDGAFIEVGCWQGRSTIALANAVWPVQVHAVDTWEGSPGEVSAALAEGRDVFAEFQANIAAACSGNVVTHRMDWRSFFAEWDEPIALLHIDATHTYEEVRDNIIAALPHMAPGSIICGDDNHHPPVQEAVWDTLGNAWFCASLWHWTKGTA